MVPVKLNLLCTALTGFQLLLPGDQNRGRKRKGRNTLDFSELSWHDARFSAFFLVDLAISNETTVFPGMSGSVNFNKQKRDDFFLTVFTQQLA